MMYPSVNSIHGIFGIIILFLLGYACGNPSSPPPPSEEFPPPTFVKEGSLKLFRGDTTTILASIDIEIAESSREMRQGLMYRHRMADTTGMLFIFNGDAPRSFWMKNTYLSLDILYINSENNIVSIYERVPPLSDRSLPSQRPAMYVLEVVAGFCEKFNVKPGDKISFRRAEFNE